jgi:hypothetical protein
MGMSRTLHTTTYLDLVDAGRDLCVLLHLFKMPHSAKHASQVLKVSSTAFPPPTNPLPAVSHDPDSDSTHGTK